MGFVNFIAAGSRSYKVGSAFACLLDTCADGDLGRIHRGKMPLLQKLILLVGGASCADDNLSQISSRLVPKGHDKAAPTNTWGDTIVAPY